LCKHTFIGPLAFSQYERHWWAIAAMAFLPVLMAFPAWAAQVVWLPQTAGSKGKQNDKNIDLLYRTYFKLETDKRKLSK